MTLGRLLWARDSDRARITIPDVVFLLMAVAFLGALAPVLYTFLNKNASYLTTGEAYLWQLVVPMLVIVMLGMIYVTAVGGSGSR